MRIAVFIMALMVVMAVPLSPCQAAGRSPLLQFELADGNTITGRIVARTITVRVASGDVLKVSLADMTELSVRLKEQRGDDERERPKVRIRMGESLLVGTLAVKEFQVASRFGRMIVKLDDVYRIRPGIHAASARLGRWFVELRDRTGIEGMAISESIRVRTGRGIMVIPLERIQRAVFIGDGTRVNVQCWNTDRIVGTIGRGTAISLKTDTGRSNVAVGKIAEMSYGPLTLKGHTSTVFAVVFAPDGKSLVSGGWDGRIKFWNVVTGEERFALEKYTFGVHTLAISPDGKRLASGSEKIIKIWDIAARKELLKIWAHTSTVLSLAFSPDGKTLASGSFDHSVKLWDVATGKNLHVCKGHSWIVCCVAFSPDGKTLASASSDKSLKLWDTAGGKETLTLEKYSSKVHAVAFSPDGKLLALVDGCDIRLLDASSRRDVITLKGHKKRSYRIAFSRDGRRLVSGSMDKTVKIWDIASGRVIATLEGHTGIITSVAFSPDGRRVASASQDKTIKIWDALNPPGAK
ncbi:MAG: WD40 repeat domain-containing protein [Phycisphaerae bacterium]|jgi:WD40 repeat protein|nr:WD40 repeat domain-containing protein [Phycisphaerae bacterium]